MTRHNPYRALRGRWMRGNFHGHCMEHSGCASVPLDEGVRLYHDLGVAAFMAVTDHDFVTPLEPLRRTYPDMVFLHGFEYSHAEHLLFVGDHVPPLYELTQPEAMAQAGELLTILAHPEPSHGEALWTLEKIAALGRLPDGVEVYDGHYGVARALEVGRQPQYTRVWDEFLTAGCRLWGFADDDFHDLPDLDNAFNMVCVEELSAQAIVNAAKRGQCYGSTGLLLDTVEEDGDRIHVVTAAPATGRFVGPGGTVLSEAEGYRFSFLAGDEAYVRFEAEGESGKLFLQPMFLEGGAT